ncbi:hypothetical protein PUN28_015474 [Cardiocondyla obscurior]|uniref:Uncharacterized protein n=1 Tax=Cardiocondyla obscurior TaxID=286306 RepID=A0AAW2EYI5_9HYME
MRVFIFLPPPPANLLHSKLFHSEMFNETRTCLVNNYYPLNSGENARHTRVRARIRILGG